jgi:hypothetical protein
MSAKPRCGIYCIINRKTGESYVGQAVNIHARSLIHFQSLRAKTHHSKSLQASFDKWGRAAFGINVLEDCVPEELDRKEHDWMLKVRPTFNSCTPDYVAVAKGKTPDGRLRKRKQIQNREPSRYICPCGGLKTLYSRGCLKCLKELSAKMVEAGYLPADHRFEWQPDPDAVERTMEQLRSGQSVRPRSDFFPSREPNRPGENWPKIRQAIQGIDRHLERDTFDPEKSPEQWPPLSRKIREAFIG